ncbi:MULTISPECIES: pentapeptide repeat-containing protein [Arthrospira]|jgi:curved DNA-binding protein CbpA|uniref:Pentapeptide repeat-containing protein n=1 Tax=Limnospira platensis NIES-46 TaxID=1236695 RepID=A0A5M3T453_LIMPL|nr:MULTISPECIES: pentapeptide repeat-containing protein [Arthrospira]AMW29012.1 molecular chaperone DnaJ [Arthrospira platensis YZ]KDR57848.1 molecular chaperone DnaJ [Arthrospira platensis str. Paraca]MBD2667868.1 pentapeptide repeat-containing protein [Arthrospira platensis FACHB-439]MBD2708680.1 pentapeptide repeat-containing protein [Arthrospira platensis FACHB-835]MDF2212829.1 pentapeptide repeat-containing protein [Arthrospira platensis NCB002]MDT9182894.1 pentapeptide repeat-containing
MTPSELNHCYRVLELQPGASLEVVDRAYKDLAFIWHPDRIPEDNQRLRQLAEDKLKEINQARDKLRSLLRSNKTKTPKATPRPEYAGAKRQTQTSHNTNSYYTYRAATPPHRPPKQEYQSSPAYQRPSYSDLTNADFRGANLKERDLSGRNLSGADLSYADLTDCFLHKVNLSGACLHRANLFRANFLQANLSYANLQEANLIGADLSGADLRGANLTGAKVGYSDRLMVKLTGANLAGAILPDGTIHPG